MGITDESVLLLLNSTEGLYSNKQNELVSLYGTPRGIFENLKSTPEIACKAVSEALYRQICKKLSLDELYKVEENLQNQNIKTTTAFSADYPQKLKDIDNPPTVLYYRGDLNLLDKPSLSIVGSRKCTAYGAKVARYYVKELAAHNFVIISGMALGIDEVAHRAAFEFDTKTVAVLGSGFNHIYPPQHLALSKTIEEEGLLITEFPPDATPQPYHFPMRNRVVSGLADGVLIVEAGRKSGTHTTLNHALDQGKKIYIVPNDIFSFSSVGSNEMLKSLQGALTTSPKDILDDFGLGGLPTEETLQLDFSEQAVADKLKDGQQHFNALLDKCGMSVGELQFILSNLEIKGVVVRTAGNFYKLTMEGI